VILIRLFPDDITSPPLQTIDAPVKGKRTKN
jgi:hypothetical protein